MKSSELSVVIPTLGRPILARTIRSLAATTSAGALEVIVAGRIEDAALRDEIRGAAAAFARFQHLTVAFPSGDSSNKKNAGLAAAACDTVAFLDDDVLVAPDWPRRILEAFADSAVGMVSGPSLVPDDLPRMARLAGLALASDAAGYVAERYEKGGTGARAIKWSRIIGCNMAFRKVALERIGRFDPRFWPGEEMVASYNVARLGLRIVFQPDAWVYHYPRATLGKFLVQIYGYGATRIRLVREGLEFEPTTVVPALWVASLALLGLGAGLWSWAGWLLAAELALYLLFDLGATLRVVCRTRRPDDLWLFFIIPLMHISYGLAEWVEFCRPDRDLSVRPRQG